MTHRRQFNGNRNDGWQRPSARTENSLQRAGDCRQPWSAFRRTSWLKSGAERVVDSPNEQTHAHVDPMYDQPHSRRQRRNVAQSLVMAANRKVPAYIPATPNPTTG